MNLHLGPATIALIMVIALALITLGAICAYLLDELHHRRH